MRSLDYSNFIFNIPSSVDFNDTLTDYVLLNYDITNTTNNLIILPTRRACRRFIDILSKKICDKFNIEYAILPKIIPVGDFDEDEILQNDVYNIFDDNFFKSSDLDKDYSNSNQISNIEKITLLSRLIMQKAMSINDKFRNMSWAQSFKIAITLSKFIDTVNNEELDLSNLKMIVPENLECHWQDTLKFLEIINIYWDSIKQNKIDASKHRVLMIKKFADSLKNSPKYKNVIIAGSTGSMPFIRYLMKSILDLNQDSNRSGYIILPGLDSFISDDAWKYISFVHPQYNLKFLLNYLKVDRKYIKNIPVNFEQNKSIEIFASKITTPNNVIGNEWNVNDDIFDSNILNKIINLKCDNQYDEAMSIAYSIYYHKKNGICRDAIIICQDRNLIKKITSCLNRFGISYIDGAGKKLNETSLGESFLLLSKLIVSNFDPIILQSLLRNNIFSNFFQVDESYNFNLINWIEKNILRGKKIYDKEKHPIDLLLNKKLNEKVNDINVKLAIDILIKLKNQTDIFYKLRSYKSNFIDIFNVHLNVFESLLFSSSVDSSEIKIFNQFIRDILINDLSSFDFLISLDDYQDIVEILMLGFTKRDDLKNQVDVNIFGSIESRMQMADFVVIPGLNEGIFPQETETDPWMSRPMRYRFGLPALEKKIGLASHDFVQFLCSAKNIMFTHSVKVGSSSAIPSRLLFRFISFSEKYKLSTNKSFEEQVHFFVKNIDFTNSKKIYKRPMPCPPVYARPKELYSTVIEKLIQDPYIVYASHILKLKKLHEINEDYTTLDFGILIHETIKSFTDNNVIESDILYKELCKNFISMFGYNDYLFYFWDSYFKKISCNFVDEFKKDMQDVKSSYSEIVGSFNIYDQFYINAKADRIDVLSNNNIRIVDYKTGKIPEEKNIVSGKNSQLIIESLITKYGTFKVYDRIINGEVEEIKYYSLKGSVDKDLSTFYKNYDEIFGVSFDEVLSHTHEGIKKLFIKYNDPNTGYIANNEEFKSDYEYLKRLKEWKF